jgi:hypothetical protein
MPWKVASSNSASPWKVAPPNPAQSWKLASPNQASPWKVASLNQASPWKVAPPNPCPVLEGRLAEPGGGLEGHPAEPGPALEGHPVEPSFVLEGRPAEPGVALEGCPIKTGCHEGRLVFRVVWCRRKDLFEERLGDRRAACVDLTGLAELLKRRVPLLIGGVGQALGSYGEADADAAVFVTCRPLDASLVRHALPASSGPPDHTASALSDVAANSPFDLLPRRLTVALLQGGRGCERCPQSCSA